MGGQINEMQLIVKNLNNETVLIIKFQLSHISKKTLQSEQIFSSAGCMSHQETIFYLVQETG